jgi:hypothetical protein
MARNRIHYFFFIIATIGLGLLSRTAVVPAIVYPYLGDVFYAVMIYFGFGFLFAKASSKTILFLAVGFCVGIEITQLYQADWLIALRGYKLGGLILGYGFLWSDLIAYTIGGLIGFAFETLIASNMQEKSL